MGVYYRSPKEEIEWAVSCSDKPKVEIQNLPDNFHLFKFKGSVVVGHRSAKSKKLADQVSPGTYFNNSDLSTEVKKAILTFVRNNNLNK